MAGRSLIRFGVLALAAGIACSTLDQSGGGEKGPPQDAGDAGTADPAGGGDGGTTDAGASACQGLIPPDAPGAPRITTFSFGQGDQDFCIAGRSDGVGNFVVGSQMQTGGRTALSFYDANAKAIGDGGLSLFEIFGQEQGYIGDGLAGTSAYVEALQPAGSPRSPVAALARGGAGGVGFARGRSARRRRGVGIRHRSGRQRRTALTAGHGPERYV